MKKLLFVSAFLLVMAGTSICFAGETEIINGLEGVDLTEIYLSRASTDQWEEDVLGEYALAPGEYVTIEFAAGEDECEWDLMAVDGQGTTAIWPNLDLCGVGSITLLPGAEAILE